jgi:hypothetical protein
MQHAFFPVQGTRFSKYEMQFSSEEVDKFRRIFPEGSQVNFQWEGNKLTIAPVDLEDKPKEDDLIFRKDLLDAAPEDIDVIRQEEGLPRKKQETAQEMIERIVQHRKNKANQTIPA